MRNPFRREPEPAPQPGGPPIGYYFDPVRMIWRHHEDELAEATRVATLEARARQREDERHSPGTDGFRRAPANFGPAASLIAHQTEEPSS